MTRAQRRIRSAKTRAASAGLPDSYRETPGFLRENPNRGKRHMPAATARVHSFTAAEAEAIRESRKDYRPLTVYTPKPTKTPRRVALLRPNPRIHSSYTV